MFYFQRYIPRRPAEDRDDIAISGAEPFETFLPISSHKGPRQTQCRLPGTSSPSIASMIWRRRKIVGLAVGAAMVSAFGYLAVVRPTYTSVSTIYVQQAAPKVIGDANSEADRSDNYLNTQCQLIDSTPIIALALTQPGVADLKTLQGVGNPIEYLKKSISAEVGKKDDLITVSIDTKDAAEGAQIVKAVVDSYSTYQHKTQHSTAAEVLDILQKQKDADNAQLEAKTAEETDFRAKYGGQDSDDPKDDPILSQEAALSDALTAARLETINAHTAYQEAMAMLGNDPAKLAQVDQPGTTADIVSSNGDQAELMKAEIFRLTETLKDQQRTYLPDHPVVRQTQARLDQLTISYVRAARERWMAAQDREEVLQSSFDEQHKLAVQQQARAAEYARLDSDVTRIEKDIDVIDGRIGEVTLNQDAGALNISVLEEAHSLDAPTHPDKMKIILAALAAGFVAGGALAVGLEKFSRRKPLVGEANAAGGNLNVLGMFPGMDKVASVVSRAMATHNDPAGAVAEASRAAVRALTYFGLNDNSGRTLLVTSAAPFDGRTTLATNLAIAMAQQGLRVILVDANSQAPKLQQIFSCGNTGLFDALCGSAPVSQSLVPTPVENLDFLPCGNIPTDAVAALNGEALVDVLGELADHYDRVIIDSPAVNRGVEARILSASCSATVLVMSPRRTNRRAIDQAYQALVGVGANVIGAVINDQEPTGSVRIVNDGPNHENRRRLTARELATMAQATGAQI